jgi:hypothetical protein
LHREIRARRHDLLAVNGKTTQPCAKLVDQRWVAEKRSRLANASSNRTDAQNLKDEPSDPNLRFRRATPEREGYGESNNEDSQPEVTRLFEPQPERSGPQDKSPRLSCESHPSDAQR